MNSLRFLVLFFLAHHAWSQPFEPYFKELSEQLHLAPPKLPKGSYQVRLWVSTSATHGEWAQEVYILTQKRKKLILEKRTFFLTKNRLQRCRVDFKRKEKDNTLFHELVANAVLTSRDQSIITDSLHNVYRSFAQTTRVETKNGEVTMVINKPPSYIRVIGGTSYYFEVMGNDFFKKYAFYSPKTYAKTYPELEELSRNVDLIRRIFIAFLENQREIS